ncbi:DUF7575 domain-containing protein [Halorubrum amylolyticum]|uniref:DUF7575 domain-containing protein n=1 Tax=Halorubrum amylolyticum TaxID=2508724 RepID=UPI001008BF08|nr:zinc ribbon domain-containing protein [Halorubrum amylolyticum]
MSDPEISRRRPWLAAALALLVSGLGHAYLGRWARAFGWYVLITATLVLVVPDAAVDRVVAGERPPIGDIAPALVVVAASVVDAYVLAVRNNRAYDRGSLSAESAGDASSPDRGGETRTDAESGASEPAVDSTTDAVSCPHCGRDADATLDFCQWCAEPLGE